MKMRIRFLIALTMLVFFAASTYWAYESSQLYVFRATVAGSLKYDLLFDTVMPLISVAALLGIFLGSLNYYKDKLAIIEGKVERHDEWMFIQHWSTALGTVVLIITGFLLGTLFIPRTIQTTEIIGFALNMHYIGILFFFFGISYYVTKSMFTGELKHMMPKRGDLRDMLGHYKAMFFGGVAPKEEKFLAAERVVFPMWIVGVGGITITGIVKTIAHIWSLPGSVMGIMTFLHGVFALYMLFMLIAHVMAGSLLPASWPLFRSMLTGKVSEKYVKSQHQKWYEEIQAQKVEATNDESPQVDKIHADQDKHVLNG